jgi:hypothetical protein
MHKSPLVGMCVIPVDAMDNKTDISNMVFDAYVTHGNSGGPVMNSGYVYGIVSFFYSDPTTNEWTNSGATCMYDGLFNIIVAERAASAERWAS